MKFIVLLLGLLIVGVFIKWLWDQAKHYDRKSLQIILGSVAIIGIGIWGLSLMEIEQYRVTSKIQGVITRFNVYRLRGEITHYDISIKGLAQSGAFVADQDNLTIERLPENQALIDSIENAHRDRQIVFITFDQITTYFVGDDLFELKSVEIIDQPEVVQ